MDAIAREAQLQVLAAYPDIPVEIDLQPLPEARGDMALIRQVWLNFLDNAVKYSARVTQPRVVISGREEKDKVIFEISDNGVGFDSNYSDALFQVFQRLHGADYPGTGVGLAIVQRIVMRHGGEVWARSTPGQGSTFGFSLPLHELTASDAHIAAAVGDQ